jgi:hypothetical protein
MTDSPLECLGDRGDGSCEGPILYRDALSGTGRRFPRCDRHWSERLDEQDRIVSEYGHPDSDIGPSHWGRMDDGGPLYSEVWDDDY